MPLSLNLSPRWRHRHLDETDSTMLWLRRERPGADGAEFQLVTADFQTAGRGQRGTTWEAERGMNLLFGFSFVPKGVAAANQFLLSEAMALAVAEALALHAGGVSVKWPNDVYVGDEKICGMLLEHDLCGGEIARTLVGVGVNVNQMHFKGDAPNPVSLRRITGRETARGALLENICERFERFYDVLRTGGAAQLHRSYCARLYRREGYHLYRDAAGEFYAAVRSVLPGGCLCLVDSEGRERTYAFKEVAAVLSL